jgi:hypothetical protein
MKKASAFLFLHSKFEILNSILVVLIPLLRRAAALTRGRADEGVRPSGCYVACGELRGVLARDEGLNFEVRMKN